MANRVFSLRRLSIERDPGVGAVVPLPGLPWPPVHVGLTSGTRRLATSLLLASVSPQKKKKTVPELLSCHCVRNQHTLRSSSRDPVSLRPPHGDCHSASPGGRPVVSEGTTANGSLEIEAQSGPRRGSGRHCTGWELGVRTRRVGTRNSHTWLDVGAGSRLSRSPPGSRRPGGSGWSRGHSGHQRGSNPGATTMSSRGQVSRGPKG